LQKNRGRRAALYGKTAPIFRLLFLTYPLLFFCYEPLCTSLRGFCKQLFMERFNFENFPTPQIIKTEKIMKYLLNYDQTQCSGCLQCQLNCSFKYFRFFHLSASYIQINSHETEYKAIFTDECTRCGSCADYCLFGALTKSREEVQP
jgi:ferredoxin